MILATRPSASIEPLRTASFLRAGKQLGARAPQVQLFGEVVFGESIVVTRLSQLRNQKAPL